MISLLQMKKYSFLVCLSIILMRINILSAYFLQKQAERAPVKRDYNRALNYLDRVILSESAKAGEFLLQKALVYLKDQKRCKAMLTFLEALEFASKAGVDTILSSNKESIYNQALQLYMTFNDATFIGVARKIHSEYAFIFDVHPTYDQLGYLVAINNVNLKLYDCFMEQLYHVIQHVPNHFIVDKTFGFIYMKFLEPAISLNKRSCLKKRLSKNL